MLKKKTIAVVGGDQRNAHLANTLAYRESGYAIYALFMEDVKLAKSVVTTDDIRLVLPQSDIVIFPLPLLDMNGNVNTPLHKGRVTLEECLDYIDPDAAILAGNVSPSAQDQFQTRGLEAIDYYQREEFAVLNAVLTAEGAVEIALRELSITLFGSNCVVTGFGRIAKALSKLLAGFGANVQVVARNYADLAWIKANGYQAVPISYMTEVLPHADVLFNTVPSVILGEDKLQKLGRHCLVIDLASKPGGVDFETAQTLGLKTIWALSLAGKVAPITAGEIMLDTVCNILQEKGKL